MHLTDATDFNPDIGNGDRGFKETPPGNETVVSSNFMNAIQEELAQLVRGAGLTLRATGSADASGDWGQVLQAVNILIANVTNALQASDINNDSGAPGADVALALTNLNNFTIAIGDALNDHENLATNAHLDSAINNTSAVVGANVKEALDNILAVLVANTSNIGSNAGSISANNAQISVNTSQISNNASSINQNRYYDAYYADIQDIATAGGSAITENNSPKENNLPSGWPPVVAGVDTVEIIRVGDQWGGVGTVADQGAKLLLNAFIKGTNDKFIGACVSPETGINWNETWPVVVRLTKGNPVAV